ncbi:hypothetical protein [Streptomyces sp.]|uniref:hypothetical protein n=1 Tax=Streptomyces sp. TaxID=1931 RepID=UPI00281276A5|nr:hypothetical protein [Streptomyces sp.]
MPGTVRAAQVVIFATTGLGVLLTVLAGVAAGAEAAGRFLGTYLMALVLFVLAFRYPKAGNGVRTASIVLASLQILFALSATARGVPLGVLPLGSAVAVIVLLGQGGAGDWFRRYRANGVPPQHIRQTHHPRTLGTPAPAGVGFASGDRHTDRGRPRPGTGRAACRGGCRPCPIRTEGLTIT